MSWSISPAVVTSFFQINSADCLRGSHAAGDEQFQGGNPSTMLIGWSRVRISRR